MRIAVFGDVNSKYPILKLFFAQTKGVDAYYCVGDVVHHNSPEGARWTDSCIRLLIAHQVTCIRGNHEKSLLDILLGNHYYTPREKHNLREVGIPKYSNLTREFLLDLKDQKEIGDVLLAHDSALGRWNVFPKRAEFEAIREKERRMLFFGHSHKRLYFRQDEQCPWWMNYFRKEGFFPQFDKLYDTSNGLCIVNPGNMERSKPPFGFYECSSYVIYDNENQT